jgi:hypothetical protein
MILTKFFKKMTPDDVTQGYHPKHQAWDLIENSTASGKLYGTPLCAPENCTVMGITEASLEIHNQLEKGYGIRLKGIETGYEYLYWHCLPVFPVNGGDSVKRGQIVAYMGNAGFVQVGGKTVPLEERTEDPEPGTHLHVEIFEKGDRIDPAPLVNWNWEPNWTTIDYIVALIATLQKKVKLLSK